MFTCRERRPTNSQTRNKYCKSLSVSQRWLGSSNRHKKRHVPWNALLKFWWTSSGTLPPLEVARWQFRAARGPGTSPVAGTGGFQLSCLHYKYHIVVIETQLRWILEDWSAMLLSQSYSCMFVLSTTIESGRVMVGTRLMAKKITHTLKDAASHMCLQEIDQSEWQKFQNESI